MFLPETGGLLKKKHQAETPIHHTKNTTRKKPNMSDLPFWSRKVQVENGYAKFIGANGEVLGSREIGPARSRDAESAVQAEFTDNDGNTIGLVFRKHPFRYFCTACGCRCEASTYSTRSPECFKHDIRAHWEVA